MPNSDILVPFGIAIIIVVGMLIVIPFFRRKSDILSAWNTLLLGLIIFTAVGSIAVKYVPTFHFEQLNWFRPSVREIQWYIVATTSFIVTLMVAYYFNTPARAFAQKRLQTWPELTAPLTIFVIGICLVAVVASVVFQRITFVGPLTRNLAVAGVPAGCVFSFALWNRRRLNLGFLFLFIAVFSSTAIYAMVVSGGRRLLLSLFLGPILCLYWSNVRYWRPSRALVAIALAACVVLSVSVLYSNFRWYNAHTKERRSASGVIEQLSKGRSLEELFGGFLKNRLDYLSQSNAHYALLTERYIAEGALTPAPLNTLRFLAAYPIPRNFWPGKPEVIGVKMTRDAAHITGGTNWGIGIAGHGAYEGGVLALMLYAVLLAFGIRVLDEPLRLQPGNPFLVYMHASALPHVVAIPRGDMGIMMINVAQSVLFAVLLGFVCRAIFGTRKRALAAPPPRFHCGMAMSPGKDMSNHQKLGPEGIATKYGLCKNGRNYPLVPSICASFDTILKC